MHLKGVQEQKQDIVKDRELKQNHSLRELMCHGVMKMSKSLKKSFSFENLAFSESCSSFKNHKLFFFPEHISYAKNSAKSWGLRLIGYSFCPQWADSSSWEAINRCPAYWIYDTQEKLNKYLLTQGMLIIWKLPRQEKFILQPQD